MFSLRKCVAIGVAGLFVCSGLVGVSFPSIQTLLFQLNVAALAALPTFYMFVGSFVGFAGFTSLILKKPSVHNDVSSSSAPSLSSVYVGSSGALGDMITLLPGTRLMNNSMDIKLETETHCWPIIAKSDAPEELQKQVVKKRRFFERVPN